MKKLKLALFFAVTILVSSQFAKAQQQKIDPVALATERKQKLTRFLGLNKEQGQQVYDAALKFWETNLTINAAGHDEPTRKRLNKENGDGLEAALKSTFTTEQYQKLVDAREKAAQQKKDQ